MPGAKPDLSQEYPEYEVVIPHHQRPKLLNGLVRQVRHCNTHKPPKRVLIVDDNSDAAALEFVKGTRAQYSDSTMRVSLLPLDTQVGLYGALRAGLDLVEAPYAVVCVDDLRIATEPKTGQFQFGYLPNPLTTLPYYLHQTLRVIASMKAADDVATTARPAGIVFPFVAKWETPETVYFADQYLYSNSEGMLPVFANEKFGFDLVPLVGVDDLELYESPFGHHYCFAVNMEMYHEVGGFDPKLDPYFFGMWDLCLAMRQKQYACYFTSTSVVYHRSTAYPKHPNSMANMITQNAKIFKASKYFTEKWGKYPRRELNRLVNPDSYSFVGALRDD